MKFNPGSIIFDKESRKQYLVISTAENLIYASEISTVEDACKINSTSQVATFTSKKIVQLKISELEMIDDSSRTK